MHISLALKVVLHKIDLPASLDEGLRGRHGKSPEMNQTVLLSSVRRQNSQNDVKNLKQGCRDNDAIAPHRMSRAW